MSLDEDTRKLIEAMSAGGAPEFRNMRPEEVRGAVETFTGLQAPPREVGRVLERSYPGPGGEQRLNVYIPEGEGPFPVVVYFHGGGFVGGSLNVVDEPARALAADARAIVMTAAYRLAPEHKFPAATDDSMAALAWAAEHAAEFGGDPSRLYAMGDSAGGNLAAVAAIRCRDEDGPKLAGQILVYPVIDSALDLPSRREFFEGYIITAPDLDWFWAQYLNSPDDANSPLATPSKAASLAGLPRALVVSLEYEVPRDEAEQYAARLADAGVEVVQRRIAGLIHGAYWMSGAVPRSREIHDAIVAFLAES